MIVKQIVFIALFLGVVNFYLAVSLARKVERHRARPFIFGTFFVLYLLQLVGPLCSWSLALLNHDRESLAPAWLVQESYYYLGVVSCFALYMLFADAVSYVSKFFIPAKYHSKRNHMLVYGVCSATLVTVFCGTLIAPKPDIYRVPVQVRHLPEAFSGMKIAMISDLHVGPFIKKPFVAALVARVNALQPDAIALVGDFVDGSTSVLAEDVAPLAELRARDGVFFVTGNHEYYWGEKEWIAHFRRLGLRVLQNEFSLIARDGAQIAMAGIPDQTSWSREGAEKTDMAKALGGIPQGVAKILLAHQPKSFREAQSRGVDLQLSGHTHAGQYFPFSLLVRVAQPYFKGLYEEKGAALYVGQGTAFWGAPLRTTGEGEITLLVLEPRRDLP